MMNIPSGMLPKDRILQLLKIACISFVFVASEEHYPEKLDVRFDVASSE